jgi:hypothetical protein
MPIRQMMNHKSETTRRRRPAETLIEVIMAIFVVALGSAAATSLVISALQTNAITRDNLLALNLATEGAEAMRNIRDSNWIKYAYDKQKCWNMNAEAAECKDAEVINNGNFSLTLDTATMKWSLSNAIADPLDLNNPVYAGTNLYYQLAYKDLDEDVNSDDIGTAVDDQDIYVSKDDPDSGALSKFYRMINISYPVGGPPPTSAQEMTVTSLVQWKDRGQVHEVRIVTELTNYQKVKVK